MSDEQPGAQPTPPAYPATPPPAPSPYGDPQGGQPYGQQPYPQQPYPQQPYGQQYGQPTGQYGQQPPYGWPGLPAPDLTKRPGNVTAASVMTWVITTINMLGLVVLLALAAADNDDFFGELTSDVDDISRADVRLGIIIGSVVLLVWAVIALVLSVLAFRGRNWARITLVVSAGVSVPFQLIGVAAVVPGLCAVATIVVIVLFFTGNANAWYRQQRDGEQQPPLPPGVTYAG